MEEQQDIEKLYNNAYNQYCQTKLEIRQIKDKLKKETSTNTLKKLQQILSLKKRILYLQRRRYENILFKKHQSYKRQQAILKFKNIIQFRLKRVCEDKGIEYSQKHRNLVNRTISSICYNKTEQDIYMMHKTELKKPIILRQIFCKLKQH